MVTLLDILETLEPYELVFVFLPVYLYVFFSFCLSLFFFSFLKLTASISKYVSKYTIRKPMANLSQLNYTR